MATKNEPRDPCRRLLINAIEERAKYTPNYTFMHYPSKDWHNKGYRTITLSQYANAIDRVAHWLDDQLGDAVSSNTVAYHGPNDPRYAIIVPAVIKTGRRILIPDGRNTSEGLQALLSSTDCKTWLYAGDDTGGTLVDEQTVDRTLNVPSVEWILHPGEQISYPYNKTFEQAAHDVIVIIHTSGTTGVPKPIYQTNGMWTAMGNHETLSQRHWPRGLSHDSWMGRTTLDCCAPQWLGGLLNTIISPVYYKSPVVILPSDATSITPAVFKRLMSFNIIESIKCPPQTIVTLYEDLESRALLKSLKSLLYVGAALDRSIGDDLCEHTRMTPLIGSTETGDQISIRPMSRKLWYTHSFVPEIGNTMIPIDSTDDTTSDIHELIIERTEDGADNVFQPAFWNPTFNGVDRIETKELYKPVTDLDGTTRWVFSARKDDLTKLSWLAKFHAADIESRIQQHPDVKSVFVGGEGRPAPYVIIEVKEGVLGCKTGEQVLEDVYATAIMKTNGVDIKEIRIPKETVLIATKDKPFRRNLKQVVMRKAVEEDYCNEIEQAYLQLAKV
ncbi:hypothetical protein DE146DRAFT_611638 [Phaeosphaeria sp. MPI-PUGE-AT-0046c]|nr:hypothetical protein DE146DRAFT_611638 [Phaeosphaeria sp. MPI-PUGE-AT-0046c]